MKEGGKWQVLRADLKRVQALSADGLLNDLSLISDAFDSIGGVDPAVTPDQHRRFTLEGLKSGVFSIEEAVKLLGATTGLAKTVWAFNLLQCGKITVDQAVKLLG